jgi:hypothetical protein
MLHFGCRKLQNKIIPKECKWAIKSNDVQVSLKKRKQKDNWWSLFKQKATGEKFSESSEDDDKE